MQKSRYDHIAKSINHRNTLNYARPQIVQEKSANDYWKEFVTNKESAEEFFRLYYPSLPDVVCKALASHIDKGVKGEVELDQYWTQPSPQQEIADELMKEIEQHRQEALENLKKKKEEDKNDSDQ